MKSMIDDMLSTYQTNTISEKKNALKEVFQEIILCALSRSGFFDKAAFYGGTALRIFYGLDRFSEDLDFSLKTPDESFQLKDYFSNIEKELNEYNINFSIEAKEKSIDSNIQSAFLKSNTKELLLKFYYGDDYSSGIARSEIIKIKFKIDTNPPSGAHYETKYNLLPMPYSVCIYDIPSLFAGKIHAILCRSWNRPKGRDLYDFVFYLQKRASYNIEHLKQRMIQSGAWEDHVLLTNNDVRALLINKFNSIDYAMAKEDVVGFIDDTKKIDIWSAEFFKQIINNLETE